MKFFGSKNKDAQEDVFADDAAEESFDAVETADFDDAADGGALSAPSRDGGAGGKGKKGIVLGLVAILLAGGAGGAYYFLVMNEPASAPRAAKVLGAPLDTPAAVDVTSDVLGGPVPPMPETPGNETAEAPEVPAGLADVPDFAAAAVADPTAAVSVENPAVDPFAALGVPPTDTPQAALDPAAVFVDGDNGAAPDMPASAPVDALAPLTAAPETAAAAPLQTPATPVQESIAAAPKEDLPMPRLLDTPAAVAPTAGAAVSQPAPAAATNAEKAIVENAAMLDQLSAPAAATAADPAAAGRTVNEILGTGGVQPAIVRPMPDSYVIVRKESNSDALGSRLKTARSALSQNRDGAALQLFNELAEDYPRDPRVSMGRALALQKMGHHEQALLVYEDVLGNDPRNLEALTNMLGILKMQNPALALEKLTELRDAYPYNADIAAQLGVSHAASQSYVEALKYFDIADSLRPGNAYVLFNRAVVYDRMGNEDKAAALYRQIIRLASEGMLKEPVPLDVIQRRLSTMR